jgi:hypothetical protein
MTRDRFVWCVPVPVLIGGCFDAKVTLEEGPSMTTAQDADVVDGVGRSTGDAAEPFHADCGPPSDGRDAALFEPGPFWDPEALDRFRADNDCAAVADLPACDHVRGCAYGQCLYLDRSGSGVCVDDARCEAPLAFQEGRCSVCLRNADKAAICCHHPGGVDCRGYRAGRMSGIGGFCAASEECEPGLWCLRGRGRDWLGTCACPGAWLEAQSSFVGCGTPDGPRDLEPDLPMFTQESEARLMVVGDSIAQEFAAYLTWILTGVGKAEFIEAAIAPDAALCDFLADRAHALPMEDTLRGRIERAARPPHLIVMQFWGKVSACMGDVEPASEAYYAQVLADASAAVAEIEAVAAGHPRPRILWVLQGPDEDQPERIRRLNQVYEHVAREHGDRTSDAGRAVSVAANPFSADPEARYSWPSHLLCTKEEEQMQGLCTAPPFTQIHPEDDEVHFCLSETPEGACDPLKSPGVMRYANVIIDDLRRWLGL